MAEIRLGAADSISLQRDLAQDLSPRARGAAARAVAALPAASQWQALLPLLTDRDEAVREVAVIEVRRLDPSVSEAGHWILAQLASGAVDPELPVTPLIEALSTQHPLAGLERVLAGQLDNAAGAAAAATALVALGTPAARAALALRLRTASPVGLVPVLAAAATLKDAAVGAACRALLFHVQPGVRVAAVRAVWALDGPVAKPFIAALAGDYDVRVRRAVAEH